MLQAHGQASTSGKPLETVMAKKTEKKTAKDTAPKFDHSSIPDGVEKMVRTDELTLSKAYQPRSGLDEETIEEYAAEMKDGTFPPVEVVAVDDKMFVVDGFHRVEAARDAKIKEIKAIVRKGSKHLAQWMAACSNRKHGLRRTNADKRRAVKMAIQAAPAASLREIADHCGVSHEMVRSVKNPSEVEPKAKPDPKPSAPAERVEPTPQGEHDPRSKEAARQLLVGIMGDVENLRAIFNHAIKQPGCTFLSVKTVMAEIDNIKSAVKAAMPHGPCVYCQGEGCTNCKKLGWMSAQQFQTAPKSLKGGDK
jgi:transposase-like protein